MINRPKVFRHERTGPPPKVMVFQYTQVRKYVRGGLSSLGLTTGLWVGLMLACNAPLVRASQLVNHPVDMLTTS